MKEIVVFDTFAFFFRNFYALPPLKNRDGFPTGLLTGFVNFLNTLRTDYHEDRFVFALDSKGDSFRKALDPNYKANRPTPPLELKLQLPVAISWIEQMGFQNISVQGFEADDVIASIARRAKNEGFKVKIVSSDKDLYQLIEDDIITLFDPVKKSIINEQGCIEKFGIHPCRFIDFQSIVGDSSDNVPGVKGIGAKGAANLINEYKTLENLYENINSVKPERIKNLLLEYKESAFLSRELVRLRDDIAVDFDIDSTQVGSINPLVKISDELMKYDMDSVLNRIKREVVADNNPPKKKEGIEFETTLLDDKDRLKEVVSSIQKESIVCIDIETDSLESRSAKIVGFGFATSKERSYYVPINHSYLGVEAQVDHDSAKEALKELLTHKLIGHNLKFDLSIIYSYFGLDRVEVYADTMILAWLLESDNTVGLDSLLKRYFGHEMISYKETVKKGEDFTKVRIEEAVKYCGEDVSATYYLYEKLLEKLEDEKELLDEAREVEFPFITTLINIESKGIKLDIPFFETLKNEAEETLKTLTRAIYELAGGEFNINSTQQLGSLLFDRLGLKTSKKTKTGYSTDEKVLSKLYDEHPIIPKILEYRESFKLKSTYIDPLIEYAKKDRESRIYTSFLQTGTATGRLSSKNPNLQNIPVRTEIGRKIRQGFVAKKGYKLISLDYSQIELRLLAHFSGDALLRGAFFEDKDIHLETAKRIFGEESAKERRDIAKTINFGLIYGMGARKLSETLKISQNEAKEYIDSYFASFPTVKGYLASLEDSISQEGFSTTLLGRKRRFDFSGAADYVRLAFLREGVNSVFQGSAADIIKLSMNKIDREFDIDLLLQIHDELIFECEEERADSTGAELKGVMENIYKLEVPLKCGLYIGDNWGELK